MPAQPAWFHRLDEILARLRPRFTFSQRFGKTLKPFWFEVRLAASDFSGPTDDGLSLHDNLN